MKTVLRALLAGLLAGIAIGAFLMDQDYKRRAAAKEQAIINDPALVRLRQESRRLKQTERWLADFEEDDDG